MCQTSIWTSNGLPVPPPVSSSIAIPDRSGDCPLVYRNASCSLSRRDFKGWSLSQRQAYDRSHILIQEKGGRMCCSYQKSHLV